MSSTSRRGRLLRCRYQPYPRPYKQVDRYTSDPLALSLSLEVSSNLNMQRALVPDLAQLPPNRLVVGSPNVLRDAAVFRAWLDWFRKAYTKLVDAGIKPGHDINVHLAPELLALNHDWLYFSKAVVESSFFEEYPPEAREFTTNLYTLAKTFWAAYYRVFEQVRSRHVYSKSSPYAFLDNRTRRSLKRGSTGQAWTINTCTRFSTLTATVSCAICSTSIPERLVWPWHAVRDPNATG